MKKWDIPYPAELVYMDNFGKVLLAKSLKKGTVFARRAKCAFSIVLMTNLRSPVAQLIDCQTPDQEVPCLNPSQGSIRQF